MYLWQQAMFPLAMGLSGCAYAVAPQQDVGTLTGQPIQPVVAKLGAPDSKQNAEGGIAYAWTIQTRVDVLKRATETEYAAGRPNTFDTMRMEPQMQSCTLRLLVDEAGIISRAEQDGPYQVCAAFSRKLMGQR